MIFWEETMKNRATEFTQNSVMSTILIATDWIRDRVSRKQKAGQEMVSVSMAFPIMIKDLVNYRKKKVKHFLEEKLDLGLEPDVRRELIAWEQRRDICFRINSGYLIIFTSMLQFLS